MSQRNRIKNFLVAMAAMAVCYSCTENIDTSSRYVFKEETISSYLSKQQIYSEYYDLLGRVPISDMSNTTVKQLMAARGNFTCFAPTNEAIHEYLKTLVADSLITEPSWDSFTDSVKLDSIRKVIVFNSIIDGGNEATQLFETPNFPVENNSELAIGNLMDSKLTVNYVDNCPDSIYINGDCPIDILNRDIPAINGFVHRIHKVIAPRNVTAASYLQNILDNHATA